MRWWGRSIAGGGRRAQRNRMALGATRQVIHGSVLAGLGLLAWSAAEYVRVRRGNLRSARWLARDLNGLDRDGRRLLRWSRPARADRLADALAFGVAPAVCAWALRRDGEPLSEVIRRDGIAVTEAAVVAGLVNQLAKQLAMRERPYADGAPRRRLLADRYGSFFSGHASSVAVISAATAFRRVVEGAPSKRLWVLPALPLATAYLRVAADKHYVTDVLAGLAVGASVALISTWLELGLQVRAVEAAA
jgi:membrane-associated phospholipid phosphatase